MKLLTKALRKKLPPLYSTEDDDDPVVQAKFFTPDSKGTCYCIEFDGEDLCFGFVVGHYPEMGYFSLSELESVRGPLGLSIERDSGFEPTRLSVVKRQEERLRR